MKITQTFSPEDPHLKSLEEKVTDLELNEIFWKMRVKTKIPDTYTLAISLLDSSVWLDIDGVTIHESKISSFQISEDLKLIRTSAEIRSLLTNPFYLLDEWATIPKEPIRTKDLSGDRKNLDSLDYRPSTVDSTEIMVVLGYSENLKIGMKQRGLNPDNIPLLERQVQKDQNFSV